MTVDWRAVFAGARLALLVAAPSIILGQTIKSLTGTSLALPLYVVLLGGLAAGGRLAARRQLSSPLTHGAFAALTAYAVLIAVITIALLALGREVADPVLLMFHALMSASAGIFGGYLAVTRPPKSA